MFYEQLLDAIVKHRVADRPDRIEPRRIRRRHKHDVPLSDPRAEAKHQILNGLSKNYVTFVAPADASNTLSPTCIGHTEAKCGLRLLATLKLFETYPTGAIARSSMVCAKQQRTLH